MSITNDTAVPEFVLEVGDVADVAWTAAGRPRVLPATTSSQQPCARCARRQPLVAKQKVVSTTFCGYSDWRCPGGVGLCACCAWIYREASLRTQAHHVLTGPARLRPLTRSQLRYVLRRPLGADEALVVPQRGRKHLLPAAQWGMVALDDAQIPWGVHDPVLLGIVVDMRRRGVGEQAFFCPTPPWALLRGQGHDQRDQLLTRWAQIDTWRRNRRLWLELALIATRTNRQPPPPPSSRATR